MCARTRSSRQARQRLQNRRDWTLEPPEYARNRVAKSYIWALAGIAAQGRGGGSERSDSCIFSAMVRDETSPDAEARWKHAHDGGLEGRFGARVVENDPWPESSPTFPREAVRERVDGIRETLADVGRMEPGTCSAPKRHVVDTVPRVLNGLAATAIHPSGARGAESAVMCISDMPISPTSRGAGIGNIV